MGQQWGVQECAMRQAVRCLAVDWAGQRAMSGSVDRSLQPLGEIGEMTGK